MTDHTIASPTKEARPAAVPDTGLAFNLDDLVQAAANRHGLSAAQTLKIADSLCELGMITSPRTDERRLPLSHFETAAAMVREHNRVKSQASKVLACAGRDVSAHNPDYVGPGWTDTPLQGEGIRPTNISSFAMFSTWVTTHQSMVYRLIYERFLAMFRPSAA